MIFVYIFFEKQITWKIRFPLKIQVQFKTVSPFQLSVEVLIVNSSSHPSGQQPLWFICRCHLPLLLFDNFWPLLVNLPPLSPSPPLSWSSLLRHRGSFTARWWSHSLHNRRTQDHFFPKELSIDRPFGTKYLWADSNGDKSVLKVARFLPPPKVRLDSTFRSVVTVKREEGGGGHNSKITFQLPPHIWFHIVLVNLVHLTWFIC